MLGRGPRHAVLAEVPASPTGSRPGSLGRAELEAFAGLLRALQGSRAVLVTGPAKSAVGFGLATAAAVDGGRIVLLECDLIEPTLAGALGLSATPGLREYVDGAAEAAQILQQLVLAGPASGRATMPLTCIAAGDPVTASAPLLGSERCRHAIEMLRGAYDLLVIDGPSHEGEPDSLPPVAALADATLFCGKQAQVPKRLPVPVSGLVVAG